MSLAFPKPEKRKRRRRRGSKTSAHRARRKATFRSCIALWSRVIKRGNPPCHFAGKLVGGRPHVCRGWLQACHGFPKKTCPATRYELWNGIPACAAAHKYYTHREAEWHHYLRQLWGDALYESRYTQATATAKHDLEQVAARLRAIL